MSTRKKLGDITTATKRDEAETVTITAEVELEAPGVEETIVAETVHAESAYYLY